MRVALRADASRRMGTGHLRRCLSLAQALRRAGAQTLLVSRMHDEVGEVVVESGQPHVFLHSPVAGFTPDKGPPHAAWAGVPWHQDAAETAEALGGFAPDWVVVDHYAFDAQWHEAVRSVLGSRVAAIDDLADRALAVDLLVDTNLQPDGKYTGLIAGRTRALLGPRYALLAGAYLGAQRHCFRRHVSSIGIFMGGTDPGDFASRVLRGVRDHAGFTGDVELVVSSRCPHLATQQALARRTGARILTDLPDLAAFFARHDLQVGSGGSAAWERSFIGVPTLVLQVADNQLAVLPRLAARGAVDWLPEQDATPEGIGRAIRDLLDDPRRRLAFVRASRGLVDGRGAQRVAAAMAMAAGEPLAFRPARGSDEGLLLDWANDPEVRARAFHPEPVTAAGHKSWFARRLAAPQSCCILVGEAPGGAPVGVARFEEDGDAWTIGYSLDAAFRGGGLGRRFLADAIGAFRARRGPHPLRGLVKEDNEASLRVFRALGFSEHPARAHGQPCREFHLKPS